jgi:hypothetical protein
MNTTRALNIGLAWINITWTVCYLVFGLLPGLAPTILTYVLHMNVGSIENIFTVTNFLLGLVFWNIIVAAGIALAGLLSYFIQG